MRFCLVVAGADGRFDTLADAQAEIDKYEALIPKLDFQADGVVIKVDRLHLHGDDGRGAARSARLRRPAVWPRRAASSS